MIITKIKRIGNTNRYNLYIDDKYCGIFLDEILAIYKLKTNQELNETQFDAIKEENDEKVSFEMAISYLEKYIVSEKGLKDYLKKKGFSIQTIEKSLQKLHDYGFVNDEKFAKNYFESLSSKNGRRVIANKLKQKGVSNEIVERLLDNVDEEQEILKAKMLAEKFVKNRDNSPKTKQKCLAHLIYKGYDYSVAQTVIKDLFVNLGDDNDWI